MARPDTWMPFYGDDYQADTGHCSAVERGAYSDLLWACWKRKNTLPKDDTQLMRLARCTPAEWKQAKYTVMAFFTDDGDHYSHKRVGIELAIATVRYERKVAAGQAGGKASGQARAKQTGSNRSTTVQAEANESQTQLQPQSPNGDTHANACVTRTPRKARSTRLADDWKPSEADRAYARNVGLTDAEIDAAGIEFSRYWRSADAAGGGLKADWHATWCSNIDRNAAAIIGRRNQGRKPGSNGRGPGSILAALGTVLDRGHEGSPGLGETSEVPPVFTGADVSETAACGGKKPSTGGSEGNVIDGEWSRVQETIGGDEIPYAAAGGIH